MEEIEKELIKWNGINTSIHKYGGIQFNYKDIEIGHIHSNGVLDILFDRKTKMQLLPKSKILDHHTFKTSGWISVYIKTKEDKNLAIELLRLSKTLKENKC